MTEHKIDYRTSYDVLRDKFAAAALQGLLANPDVFQKSFATGLADGSRAGEPIAVAAITLADTMMKELGYEPTTN